MASDDRRRYDHSMGRRGDWEPRWIGAFNLADGEEMWRFVPVPSAGELGAETWGTPEALEHGGGSSGHRCRGSSERHRFVAVGKSRSGLRRRSPERATTSTPTPSSPWTWKTGKPILVEAVRTRTISMMGPDPVSPLPHGTGTGKSHNLSSSAARTAAFGSWTGIARGALRSGYLEAEEHQGGPSQSKASIVCPGLLGGQEWSATAYDPDRNIAYLTNGDLVLEPRSGKAGLTRFTKGRRPLLWR